MSKIAGLVQQNLGKMEDTEEAAQLKTHFANTLKHVEFAKGLQCRHSCTRASRPHSQRPAALRGLYGRRVMISCDLMIDPTAHHLRMYDRM